MKLCFFSPYMPKHFGGGEKHLLDVAQIAAEQHQVFIAFSRDSVPKNQTLNQVKKAYQVFFDGNLENIEFIESPLGSSQSAISKLLWTARFDGIYYVTDGSLFFSLADRNYLHIQVPFTNTMNTPLSRAKLMCWTHKNTNSNFTKNVVEKSWRTKIDLVLNPMVDGEEFAKALPKSNSILSVGRFFRQLHSKRQDILIEMFKKLCEQRKSVKKNWQLILAGSVEDFDWLDELKISAKGYPIIFENDVTRSKLIKLYLESNIFWHAAGYGVNQKKNPECVEHFGISTVEAMSAGSVPLVYLAGGQVEVLGEKLLSLGWDSQQACLDKTWDLIKHPKKLVKLSKQVKQRADAFESQKFAKKVNNMFKAEKS